jgi:Enoyl-(Acyl carrier protein) reductase
MHNFGPSMSTRCSVQYRREGKGGLKAISRVLASELSPRGIRINIVIPAGVDSSIWSASYPTPEAFAAVKNRVASTAPPGRFGKAEDVANAVLFLDSDEASNIQGAEIVIDGGATCAPSDAPFIVSVKRGRKEENEYTFERSSGNPRRPWAGQRRAAVERTWHHAPGAA